MSVVSIHHPPPCFMFLLLFSVLCLLYVSTACWCQLLLLLLLLLFWLSLRFVFFIFHAVAHWFCQLVSCVCVSISLFWVSTLTQLNSKSQLAKSFFFRHKTVGLSFLFHRKCYRFRNESRIVRFAYQYISHCYNVLRSFCLQHTHTYCRKVCSFSCKWICFHHGELEEPPEFVVFCFGVCACMACMNFTGKCVYSLDMHWYGMILRNGDNPQRWLQRP